MAMKFDEFEERLRELKEEFTLSAGRAPETMAEFEAFLVRKKFGRVRQGVLRSLKGFDL